MWGINFRNDNWILVELNLWRATKEIDYTLKSVDENLARKFEPMMRAMLC